MASALWPSPEWRSVRMVSPTDRKRVQDVIKDLVADDNVFAVILFAVIVIAVLIFARSF